MTQKGSIMKAVLSLFFSILFIPLTFAQLEDPCKLKIGTNLAGLSDWGREQPFVDLMRSSRTWFTKDAGNPNGAWNSENQSLLSYLENGYPTHSPQVVAGSSYPQIIATIWGDTGGWEDGSYTVLFDGDGQLEFWGVSNFQHSTSNSCTFDFSYNTHQVVEMRIITSDINNPVQNIRILKNDYLDTYQSQPFNPIWLEKVKMFKSVRFMDWGQTNNWAQPNSYEWDFQEDAKIDWRDRAKVDFYTWTTPKGIPYEMFVKLMNDYSLDGWVCVPHNASDDYMIKMAEFFHNRLDEDLQLTVEYSNEIWNWIFGQAQWLHKYGCIETGISWPEGTVPYIQNCMDLWTDVWQADIDRLTRVVGVQTGWLDVAQRTAFNMTPRSFDAIGGTYYFGLGDDGHDALDALGASTTVEDIASVVRNHWELEKNFISDIKTSLADPLDVPLIFYEGGQHLTPTPFGVVPSYEQALIDIQRDTAMYNLYNEWFGFIRTLQEGDKPIQCMNFSLISDRSAQYGSWGIWESMFQDTTIIPAPKLKAILENIDNSCWEDPVNTVEWIKNYEFEIYPNPAHSHIQISWKRYEGLNDVTCSIIDLNGQVKLKGVLDEDNGENTIDVQQLKPGFYIFCLYSQGKLIKSKKLVIAGGK